MARPVKWRKIENMPGTSFFFPSAEGSADVPQNVLLIEEYEAVRLKDLEGLEQEECAEKMQVSRPTFQRILLSAREKIADSLVHGKAIRVAGGNYTVNICPAVCMDCGRKWQDSFEHVKAARDGEYVCPSCGSGRIECGQGPGGGACRRNCRRRGRGPRGS